MWLLKIDTNSTEQSREPSNAQSRAPSNPVQQQDVSMYRKKRRGSTKDEAKKGQREEKTRKERESEQVQSCALFPNVIMIQVGGWCFK